jgi:hypothetical protein
MFMLFWFHSVKVRCRFAHLYAIETGGKGLHFCAFKIQCMQKTRFLLVTLLLIIGLAAASGNFRPCQVPVCTEKFNIKKQTVEWFPDVVAAASLFYH